MSWFFKQTENNHTLSQSPHVSAVGYGGLSFLLRCNYGTKHIDGLPSFYKDILMFFNELKTLYNHDRGQDMILFNNKEILTGGKPIFISEWFNNNILFCTRLAE